MLVAAMEVVTCSPVAEKGTNSRGWQMDAVVEGLPRECTEAV
jgi:hypothetical protein